MDRKAPLNKGRSKSVGRPPEESELIMHTADRDDEEFKEFSEPDTAPAEASPEFKEGLRKKLLKLMKNLYGLWVLYVGGGSLFN